MRETITRLEAIRANISSSEDQLAFLDEQIQSYENLLRKKEEDLEHEVTSQISELKQALESLHKQKLAIHKKLSEETIEFDMVK
mgnify:CR=1 FL=1